MKILAVFVFLLGLINSLYSMSPVRKQPMTSLIVHNQIGLQNLSMKRLKPFLIEAEKTIADWLTEDFVDELISDDEKIQQTAWNSLQPAQAILLTNWSLYPRGRWIYDTFIRDQSYKNINNQEKIEKYNKLDEIILIKNLSPLDYQAYQQANEIINYFNNVLGAYRPSLHLFIETINRYLNIIKLFKRRTDNVSIDEIVHASHDNITYDEAKVIKTAIFTLQKWVFFDEVLDYCVRNEELEMMNLFLDYGLDPNHPSFGILHKAVHYKKLYLVELLLRRGADPLLVINGSHDKKNFFRSNGYDDCSSAFMISQKVTNPIKEYCWHGYYNPYGYIILPLVQKFIENKDNRKINCSANLLLEENLHDIIKEFLTSYDQYTSPQQNVEYLKQLLINELLLIYLPSDYRKKEQEHSMLCETSSGQFYRFISRSHGQYKEIIDLYAQYAFPCQEVLAAAQGQFISCYVFRNIIAALNRDSKTDQLINLDTEATIKYAKKIILGLFLKLNHQHHLEDFENNTCGQFDKKINEFIAFLTKSHEDEDQIANQIKIILEKFIDSASKLSHQSMEKSLLATIESLNALIPNNIIETSNNHNDAMETSDSEEMYPDRFSSEESEEESDHYWSDSDVPESSDEETGFDSVM